MGPSTFTGKAHSDRGVQYASGAYQDLLGFYGITCSMSGKGNCYDNAMMESFMGSLKVELVYGEDWTDHNQAGQAVFETIEAFYNRVRLHSSLGYKSPLVYEQQTAWLTKTAVHFYGGSSS